MRGSAGKIEIQSFEDLFSGGDAPASDKEILDIPLYELFPFQNHPFKVLDDEVMQKTVECITQYGVLVPGIARPRKEGGYELIAGHRRKRGSELAGNTTMPVLVRELDDDEATIIMVDSNIQREKILPSEKAWAYKMKLAAIKHQGARNDLTLERPVLKMQARDKVAQDAGEKSGMAVTRYISLTLLIPPLLELVDQGKFSVSAAADYITPLKEVEQELLYAQMTLLSCTPTTTQLTRLKKYSQDGKLDENVIEAILAEEHPDPAHIILKGEKIKSYFPPSYTPAQIQSIIFNLLDRWKMQQT